MLTTARLLAAPAALCALAAHVVSAAVAAIASTAALGCASYDAPPSVAIHGIANGKLSDPEAPFELRVSEPIDASTLRFSIVPYVTDVEGNLPDEDADPATKLEPVFSHDGAAAKPDRGGVAEVSADGTRVVVRPTQSLPIGRQLLLIVEPGLTDRAGERTSVRKRTPFAYAIPIVCAAPTQVFRPGAYFFLVEVDTPVQVQLQLFAAIALDPATGELRARFANADRNPDPARCPTPCDATEACRLVPAPACVAPSERAGTVDEFSDYLPYVEPPKGYSFEGDGCAVDHGKTVAFAMAPIDVAFEKPPVTLHYTELAASLAPDDAGILRGTGTLSARDVTLGGISSGPGAGTLTVRSIPADRLPPGVAELTPKSP